MAFTRWLFSQKLHRRCSTGFYIRFWQAFTAIKEWQFFQYLRLYHHSYPVIILKFLRVRSLATCVSELAWLATCARKPSFPVRVWQQAMYRQFVIFNPRKVWWNWMAFYQNSFVISPDWLYHLIIRDIGRLTNEVFTSNPIVPSKQ